METREAKEERLAGWWRVGDTHNVWDFVSAWCYGAFCVSGDPDYFEAHLIACERHAMSLLKVAA